MRIKVEAEEHIDNTSLGQAPKHREEDNPPIVWVNECGEYYYSQPVLQPPLNGMDHGRESLDVGDPWALERREDWRLEELPPLPKSVYICVCVYVCMYV